MKNLVRLNTQDITKARPVASTRLIAEEFNKRHADVIRKIESLISDESATFFNERKIALVEYLDKKGEMRKEYLLNRDQFIFIVMGFTGTKANKVKEEYIKQFNLMERELLARENTRAIIKSYRNQLTSVIDECLEDGTTHKKFAFSNYTKLVYKKVLGKTVKKFKEENKLKESDNVRDFLSIEQLKQVQDMETKIANWIDGFSDMLTDKEIYAKIKEKIG